MAKYVVVKTKCSPKNYTDSTSAGSSKFESLVETESEAVVNLLIKDTKKEIDSCLAGYSGSGAFCSNSTSSTARTLKTGSSELFSLLKSLSKLAESEKDAKTRKTKDKKSTKRTKLLKNSSSTESHEKSNVAESSENVNPSATDTNLKAQTAECATIDLITCEKHEFLKTKIDCFCESRIPFINLLCKDLKKLRNFMDYAVVLKNNVPENHVRNVISIHLDSASHWKQLCLNWDATRDSITNLLSETDKIFLGPNKKYLDLSFQQFYDYGNPLHIVFFDLYDLEELCKMGLNYFRRFCFYFEDYVFLTHVFSVSELISTLRETVEVESDYFTAFDYSLRENNLISV